MDLGRDQRGDCGGIDYHRDLSIGAIEAGGVDGGEESSEIAYDFRISRYDLPNFSVTIQPDNKYYLPNQNALVKVRADYLFGQSVKRGHVRVVRENEREWNYAEQKWDIEEGEIYEGETDADGSFDALIKLADEHKELGDNEYRRFKDISYAAYFTDATTNRTEQRRFDLRVTKEAIHVYVIGQDSYDSRNRNLPLTFYLSTFYADGSPAQCRVNVSLAPSIKDLFKGDRRDLPFVTVRTNRYGLAKVSGHHLPVDLKDYDELDLSATAGDSHGQTGSTVEQLSLDEDDAVLVETEKSIYQTDEPITALITSSARDLTVVVDLVSDQSVIRSERLRLHDGRGSSEHHRRAGRTAAVDQRGRQRHRVAEWRDLQLPNAPGGAHGARSPPAVTRRHGSAAAPVGRRRLPASGTDRRDVRRCGLG